MTTMPAIEKTSMPSQYLEVRKGSFGKNENNDCAVVAVAIVCGVSYDVAHAELKRCGRKDRQGTYNSITQQAVKNLGKELKFIPSHEFIRTYPGVHSKLRHVTTHHPRRFPKSFDKSKTYLWSVRGHILAVKDGTVIDWSINKAKHVYSIYEVVDKI